MPLSASRGILSPRARWFSAAAVLAVFGLLLVFFVWQERAMTLEREQDRLLTQIRVIDATLTHELAGVNAALLGMGPKTELSAKDTARNLDRSATMSILSDAMPTVRTMLMIDVHGKVLSSNRPEAIDFDTSQRPYFLTVKSQPSAQTLYVAAPFTTALKVYALNLAKAWLDAKNQLIGVTTAVLDPEYFKVLLSSVLYADDMRITLIHGDGLAFMTVPANTAIQGTNVIKPGNALMQHVAAGSVESFHAVDVSLTGEARMVAFRTLQPVALHMDKPLLLAVSRDMDAVLAPWHRLAWLMGGSYVLVCTLTVFGLSFLRRKQNALLELSKARAQDAREHSERLDLAVSGANLGLFDLDMLTGIRHVNARAQEMVGDGPDDPVDTYITWGERRHPEDQEKARAALRAHEQGQTDALTMDYRVKHKDGHWVWIHSRARITQRSPDGQALRMVGIYQDVTERKAAEAQIAEFAFRDPLTNLPNRRLLMDRLTQAQVASARSKKPAALLFMDLDHFKWINDTMGHDMGDLLLQQVAQRLRTGVRQSDTVARFGGDEFVVVLDQLGDTVDEALANALRMADKILTSLLEPMQLGKKTQTMTGSIGITVFLGEAASAEQLLKQADQALYQAKAAGRNQAVVYSNETPPEETLPMALEK